MMYDMLSPLPVGIPASGKSRAGFTTNRLGQGAKRRRALKNVERRTKRSRLQRKPKRRR